MEAGQRLVERVETKWLRKSGGGLKMYYEGEERPSLARRTGAILNRAEALYLKVLRAVILLIATLLLAFAGWLAITSAYKISRSPESVKEEQATVSADELTDAQLPADTAQTATNTQPTTNAEYAKYYQNFAGRYYDLYRTKFEPYRQADDKQLSLTEFDDSFLNTSARLAAVMKGEVQFSDEQTDLESLLAVMREAADKPATRQRLEKYRAAKKVPITRSVDRVRTEFQRGWDSSATSCPGWYTNPIGCPVIRPVNIPYTERVTELQYPKGTQSPAQIFRAFQDRFFDLLQQRREANAAKANGQRESIVSGIAEGKLSLVTAMEILGAFLVLMFFFLLIAIERHQRRIADITLAAAAE
jgi:hypothetical protein